MSTQANPCNSRKAYPHVPKHAYDGHPMHFFHLCTDGSCEGVSRAGFFDLMRRADEPMKQTFIDAEAGAAYFFPLDNALSDFAIEFHRANNAEAQRRYRSQQCVWKHTKKCDGWIKDADGNRRCDMCDRPNICRTFSLNKSLPEGDDELGDLFEADTDIESMIEEQVTRDILIAALSSLPEADRAYILRRYQPDMTIRTLAEEYGIADFRYASKKANHILERLKAAIDRLDPK